VKGFDENVVWYEESTLTQKLENQGMNVKERIQEYILHDEDGFNLKKWIKKKHYYAESTEAYVNKYKKYGSDQLGINYRTKIFISQGKWKILIKHPILTTGLIILKGLEFIAVKI